MKKSKTQVKSKVTKKVVAPRAQQEVLNEVEKVLKSEKHCVICFSVCKDQKKKGIVSTESILSANGVNPRLVLKVVMQQLEVDPALVASAIFAGVI